MEMCTFRALRPFLPLARAAVALVAAAALVACVHSETPIMTGGQPLFGKEPLFHLYGLHGGAAHQPANGRFRWDGARYVLVGGDLKEVSAFSVFPLADRDFIVQSVDERRSPMINYTLARWLADGAYLVIALDPKHADAATRQKHCLEGTSCRIKTPEALMAFARATDARPHEQGALALLIADENRGTAPESAYPVQLHTESRG